MSSLGRSSDEGNGTDPAEHQENVFKEDPAAFPVVGPIMGIYPGNNGEVVEQQEGNQSSIQGRLPVFIQVCHDY